MARNREHVKPLEESQSDSDEEENEEGSSEEDDSEPEQTQTATQNKPQPQMAAKSQQLPAPSSSEEDESGSETESESDGPASNPNAPEPVIPTKSAAAKRPDEGSATKNTKRLRKTVECDPSEKNPLEKKSNLFQRIWSEDDEIVILKGMVDYTSKYKSDPIWDLNAFHDFIKKNLHIDVTRTQLQDKIRRLKKKYENNKSKEKEGKERKNPHEQNAYDLSKMIWGASKKVNPAETEEAKDVKIVSGEGEKLHAKRLNSNSVGATMEERMLIAGGGYFGLSEERMLIAGGEYFGLGQGLEGEQDWQKLRVDEIELFQKQLDLRVAQTKLVLKAMKARDH